MQDEKKYTKTDKPIDSFENDEFQLKPYISGLTEFIKECDTPMTIAIQGDWGCGKTSMMNMARTYLKETTDIIDVWFNTWQFSQFNMDEQLTVTFLQHLISELSNRLSDKDDKKKKLTNKLLPFIQSVTLGVTKQFVGSDISDAINGMLTKAQLDLIDEISTLKDTFQDLITEVTDQGSKRVIVFIDDLDRLQPVRAVELLEILKLFMDCDGCIFVMAIDTSVVFQGIREKYGHDMSDEKAQSFFDKMIQLPFKMPVAYYKLDNMMERLLPFLKDEKNNAHEYITLIRKTANTNPRTIKRLANSILLTIKVAEKKGIFNDVSLDDAVLIRKLFVALACIQLRYETVYNFIVDDISEYHIEKLFELKLHQTSKTTRGEELINALLSIGMPNIEIQNTLTFYDIVHPFLKYIETFINNACNNNYSKRASFIKLVKVISLSEELNFSTDNSETNNKETLPLSNTTSAMTDTSIKQKYSSMIENGQGAEVYEDLLKQHIYPPINKVIEDADELKKCKTAIPDIHDMYLYQRIHNVLKHYCSPETKNSYIYYSLVYRETPRSFGNPKQDMLTVCFDVDTITTCLRFSVPTLRSPEEIFQNKTDYFKHTEAFIQKLRAEYTVLQTKYGDTIFPNYFFSENIKVSLEKIEINGFPIFNEVIADIIIDFLTNVVKNPPPKLEETTNYKGEIGDLINAANGINPDYIK